MMVNISPELTELLLKTARTELKALNEAISFQEEYHKQAVDASIRYGARLDSLCAKREQMGKLIGQLEGEE